MSYRTDHYMTSHASPEPILAALWLHFRNHGITCVRHPISLKLATNPQSPFLISKLIPCSSLLSLAKAPHLPHCNRDNSHQCDSHLGLWKPRTRLLLHDPVQSQVLRQWLPGSGRCGHDPIQHRWTQPLLRVRVPCHGCQQHWPRAAERPCGDAHRWTGPLLVACARPSAHAECQHNAGAVGIARGTQRANQGLPGLLQLGPDGSAQRVAEAQHRRQQSDDHLEPDSRYHLQPQGAGLHLGRGRATFWRPAGQNPAGRWAANHGECLVFINVCVFMCTCTPFHLACASCVTPTTYAYR